MYNGKGTLDSLRHQKLGQKGTTTTTTTTTTNLFTVKYPETVQLIYTKKYISQIYHRKVHNIAVYNSIYSSFHYRSQE